MYLFKNNKIHDKYVIMINIIACVTPTSLSPSTSLAIGRNGDLLFKLKRDMIYFKNITTELNRKPTSSDKYLSKNIVLMGRKTYYSIPRKFRPLKDRINIVLTNDQTLLNSAPESEDMYFMTMESFNRIYDIYNPNVFVIGGSEIYNAFLSKADKLYVTIVKDEKGDNIQFTEENKPDTFINNFLEEDNYKKIDTSEIFYEENSDMKISYTFNIYCLK
jgi:dihydrofolate reductase